MRILKLTVCVLILSCMFVSSFALAQMENTVAVLPIQANRAVAKSTTAEIYSRLTAPLLLRDGFSVIEPNVTVKKLGKIRGSILSKENLSVLGPRFDATLVVGIKLKLYSSIKVNRMNYKYEIGFWDVNGQSMVNTAKNECKDCTDMMLGELLEKDLEKVYSGPFILGLDTEPNGATITGSKEQWGETPLRKVLPGGNYTITIEKPGYKKMEVEFPMPDDRPIYATLPLEEDPDYVAPVVAAPVVVPTAPSGNETLSVPSELPSLTGRSKGELAAPPVGQNYDDDDVVPQKEITQKVQPETEEELQPQEVQEEEQKEMEKRIAESPIVKKNQMTTKRKWAWRTLGLTFAMAAGGVGFTVAALNSDSKAGDSSISITSRYDYADRRDQYWIGSYVMYGLTAAALTTSLVLFFTDDPAKSGPEVSVAPSISPDTVGVSTLVRY